MQLKNLPWTKIREEPNDELRPFISFLEKEVGSHDVHSYVKDGDAVPITLGSEEFLIAMDRKAFENRTGIKSGEEPCTDEEMKEDEKPL